LMKWGPQSNFFQSIEKIIPQMTKHIIPKT